jgi:serine/threonine-protein kinase
MGEVYEGYDLIGLRSVAVKMIHARRATDIANLYRFLTEASAAASIAHPAVVKTVHLDVADDGRLFQILELVDGETVASRIARGAFLRPHEAARVGAILADALATAHAAGVVHRDIKPSNVMLTASEPGVKILDFGLCKLEDDELSVGGAPLTRTGHIMGTPAYMSPEQIQDPQSVTSSTDVYSLGLLLFELVMGVPPFDAQSPADFFMAHTQCEPRHLAPLEMEGAAELDAIVHAALQKNPTARPSARELAERLAALADARDVPSADELVRGHQRALSAATAEMRMPDPSATSVTGIPELAALAEAPEDHAFAADADRETVGSEPVVSSTSRPSASLAVSGERPTRTSEKWKRARG